jgi:hypothetical protein
MMSGNNNLTISTAVEQDPDLEHNCMERPGGYKWPETGTDSPCKTLLLLATQLKYVIRGVNQTNTWVIG